MVKNKQNATYFHKEQIPHERKKYASSGEILVFTSLLEKIYTACYKDFNSYVDHITMRSDIVIIREQFFDPYSIVQSQNEL